MSKSQENFDSYFYLELQSSFDKLDLWDVFVAIPWENIESEGYPAPFLTTLRGVIVTHGIGFAEINLIKAMNPHQKTYLYSMLNQVLTEPGVIETIDQRDANQREDEKRNGPY